MVGVEVGPGVTRSQSGILMVVPATSSAGWAEAREILRMTEILPERTWTTHHICATWATTIREIIGGVWAVFLSTTLHTASGTGIIPMTIPKAHAQEERQRVRNFTREAPDRI